MKFSIITSIYNEEKLIKKYFSNLLNLSYNLKKLSIIFVNDGSTDNSKKVLKKIKKEYHKFFSSIKIFNNENYGRSYTRLFGAKKSINDNLIFLDVKCLIQENSIKTLENYLKFSKEKCIMGNVENRFYDNNISSRIFYLFHKKLYKKFKSYEKIYINNKNFDDIPKGTGIMFCKKNLFLDSQIKNIFDKDSSDDTKLIKNILNNTKYKKVTKLENFLSFYFPRKKIFDEIKHTFQRGPKFIDYYFKPKRKYFIHIILLIIGILFFIISLYINFKLIYLYLIIGFISNILIFIYLSENLKDFFICFIFCPIFISSFLLGILKGIFLKIMKKLLPKFFLHKYNQNQLIRKNLKR